MVVKHSSQVFANTLLEFGAYEDSIEIHETMHGPYIVTASFEDFEIEAQEFDTVNEFVQWFEEWIDE